MGPKLFLLPLALALPLSLAAQQPGSTPTTEPEPIAQPSAAGPQTVAPAKPGISRPVSPPQENTPAPPPVPRALLRRIAMIDLPGRPGFQSVAIANGMLLMAHPADNTVDVFSLRKRRLVDQVKDMKGANGIAVDQGNAKVYVANANADEIAVLSTQNWQVERRIPLKAAPTAVLLDSENSALYATNWRDLSISRVDLRTNAVNTVVVGGRPESLALDPAYQRLYASLEDLKQVIVLDPSLNVIKRFPLVASLPTGIAFDARNRRLYVAVRHAVIALDADSGREIDRVAAPAGIDTLWLDPASNFLYGCAEGGSVLVMTTAGRLTVEREFSTDVKGHTLAFDPSQNMLYMPGGRDGRSKLLILRHVKGEQPQTPQVATN